MKSFPLVSSLALAVLVSGCLSTPESAPNATHGVISGYIDADDLRIFNRAQVLDGVSYPRILVEGGGLDRYFVPNISKDKTKGNYTLVLPQGTYSISIPQECREITSDLLTCWHSTPTYNVVVVLPNKAIYGYNFSIFALDRRLREPTPSPSPQPPPEAIPNATHGVLSGYIDAEYAKTHLWSESSPRSFKPQIKVEGAGLSLLFDPSISYHRFQGNYTILLPNGTYNISIPSNCWGPYTQPAGAPPHYTCMTPSSGYSGVVILPNKVHYGYNFSIGLFAS